MLSLQRWCEQPEVEHIAPQKKSEGWNKDLYEGDLIDLVGNLVLLPKSVNSSANNKSWEQKRLYYRILGAPENVSQYLDSKEVTDLGIDTTALTPSTLRILSESKYHAYLELIADVSTEWNPAIVKTRSERMAVLVWESLSSWVGL